MLLSIIIVNYKTWDITSDCIHTVYESLGKNMGKDVEAIVVDNGSGDEDVKKLQKLRDKLGFKFFISKENLGFAGGCNFGSTVAKGSNLLFLNSDTKVEGGILEMSRFLKSKTEVGILGGKLIKTDGSAEMSTGKFYNIWHLTLMLIGGERIGLDRDSPSETTKVDWVSGGFLMVKKELFDKLNGFDEGYFMYLEDMDFCMRSRSQGYETYFYKESQVVHSNHGSASRSFAIYNIYKSLLYFYKKNKSDLEYNIARYLMLIKAISALGMGKIFGRVELSKTYEETLKLFRK